MALATTILGIALAAAVPAAGDGAGLTDPTRPVDYLPASARAQPLPEELIDWRLTAVRIGATDRSAVLNGKVVRAGDSVGRARVLEINPGIVTVEFDRRQVEVRLHAAGVKTKTKANSETSVKP